MIPTETVAMSSGSRRRPHVPSSTEESSTSDSSMETSTVVTEELSLEVKRIVVRKQKTTTQRSKSTASKTRMQTPESTRSSSADSSSRKKPRGSGATARKVIFPDTKQAADRTRRQNSGAPESGDAREVIKARDTSKSSESTKKAPKKPSPSKGRRDQVRALPHAIKIAAFDEIDEIIKSTIGNKENTKANDECIRKLSDFKEAHFGDKDSEKFLETQLAASEHRSQLLINEVMLLKGFVGNILGLEGMRYRLNMSDRHCEKAKEVDEDQLIVVMEDRLNKDVDNVTLHDIPKSPYSDSILRLIDADQTVIMDGSTMEFTH